MEMSASRKNNVKSTTRLALLAITLTCASVAEAEIVFLTSGAVQSPNYVFNRQVMPSIVMVPVTERATTSSYLMQRSLSWSAYHRSDKNTGQSLVYVPSVSGAMSATSPRQANVRENMARANAYRLEYYGK